MQKKQHIYTQVISIFIGGKNHLQIGGSYSSYRFISVYSFGFTTLASWVPHAVAQEAVSEHPALLGFSGALSGGCTAGSSGSMEMEGSWGKNGTWKTCFFHVVVSQEFLGTPMMVNFMEIPTKNGWELGYPHNLGNLHVGKCWEQEENGWPWPQNHHGVDYCQAVPPKEDAPRQRGCEAQY